MSVMCKSMTGCQGWVSSYLNLLPHSPRAGGEAVVGAGGGAAARAGGEAVAGAGGGAAARAASRTVPWTGSWTDCWNGGNTASLSLRMSPGCSPHGRREVVGL